MHTCKALEKKGIDVTYVGVDENAMINPDDVVAAIREDTALVWIMIANNEVRNAMPETSHIPILPPGTLYARGISGLL